MNESVTLQKLHQFKGHPGEFWSAFLTFAAHEVEAPGYVLLSRGSHGWKIACQNLKDLNAGLSKADLKKLQFFAESCLARGCGVMSSPFESSGRLLGVRLETGTGRKGQVVLFFILEQDPALIKEKLSRLRLLADCPAIYEIHRSDRTREKRLGYFTDLLELLYELNATRDFLAAAMLVVNVAVAANRCSRVSLGWLEKGYVRVQAISHMESFEGKMEIVARLEAAMEEAVDQDEEIVYPARAESGPVVRDHGIYADRDQAGHILSLPLRWKGQVQGVLTCERSDKNFSSEELLGLRILASQVTARLTELKSRSRWIGPEFKDQFEEKTKRLFGPEYSMAKLAGLMVFFVLLVSIVGKAEYRVEAPFILKSEDVRQVSAPVEGYIEEVHVKIGQKVEQGQLLLSLDNRDLHLEEAAALAKRLRHLREAEKAQARGSLIDMKIAQAQAQQIQARLDLIRYRLDQMQIRSTMNGMVVEGDLEELRGAPVKKGDILFRIARHEKLFAEMKVAEQDIHEAAAGQTAELAFIGRPDLKFPLVLERIDPVAQAVDSGNVFFVRGKTWATPESWWRPGMSGIARIEVGRRRIIWIVSHRTIDFLRMLIWW